MAALRLGPPHALCQVQYTLAELAQEEGDLDEAEAWLLQSSPSGDRVDELTLLERWGDLAWRRRDNERAVALLARARVLREETGIRWASTMPAVRAGSALLLLGRREEARSSFLEVRKLAAAISCAFSASLPDAYLALIGELDPRSVPLRKIGVVPYEAEACLVLHRAGAGGDHLERARSLCMKLSRHLKGARLEAFWRFNPIARGVLEEDGESAALAAMAGPTDPVSPENPPATASEDHPRTGS